MDTNLAKELSDAIQALQGLVGENATINQITYPCIVGMESKEQDFMYGGEKSISHVAISINLPDILKSPVPPAIGNPVLLIERCRSYRLNSISYTQTTWELDLV